MDLEYDAFDEGIEPGGLRSRNEIKVLICYLLKSIDQPISKQLINEILQENGLANYFEINQAVSDLVKAGSLEEAAEEDEPVYSVTEQGRSAAQTLEVNLPRAVREKAVNAAIKLLTRAKREQENRFDIEKLENGYHVTFTIYDSTDELLKLTIFVADSMQVETVRKNFLDDPVKLYSNIIASLTVE
uniref:DUF4364 family protein n=1 Tax=Candidatus Fimivicinus sp. TaxID=3056640 RepID=UPI003FEE4292